GRAGGTRLHSKPPRVFDDQGRVVAESARLVHLAAARPRRQLGCGDLVVDAPADVVGPGLAAVAPPRIGLAGRFRVQPPVYVDPPELVEHAADPGPLLGQKAGVLLVRPPVLQIDLAVRDVYIAAQQDLATADEQLFEMRKERVQEAKFGRLALRRARAGRKVDRYHVGRAEFGLHITTLPVELFDPESDSHVARALARKQRRSAVAAGLGKMEVR